MRELKFRAWDTELGRLNASYFRQMVLEENENNIGSSLRLDVHIHLDGNQRTIIEQYTGLKDKNGKEIYEGDIVEKDGLVYRIKWEDGCFVIWRGERYIRFVIGGHAPFCKVIGNIHENSELLEEK